MKTKLIIVHRQLSQEEIDKLKKKAYKQGYLKVKIVAPVLKY